MAHNGPQLTKEGIDLLEAEGADRNLCNMARFYERAESKQRAQAERHKKVIARYREENNEAMDAVKNSRRRETALWSLMRDVAVTLEKSKRDHYEYDDSSPCDRDICVCGANDLNAEIDGVLKRYREMLLNTVK